MIVAAVPVKDVTNAKQRLMRVLDGPERRELARAMLIDVLRAFGGAGVDRVWVVTREPEVAAIARSLGAEPLAEAENRGHTAAVATAQAEAARVGARAFLTIPGDVPCVSGAEIRALVAALTGPPAAVFVPSCGSRRPSSACAGSASTSTRPRTCWRCWARAPAPRAATCWCGGGCRSA
ncbi:MAG: hypothetical protein E6K82_18000 [Candidatus Rokuibacteriota bacterium]|nr:MAG: hypothetical protein E6K82_18000 [Candidatus Rokubacteria bacterium]